MYVDSAVNIEHSAGSVLLNKQYNRRNNIFAEYSGNDNNFILTKEMVKNSKSLNKSPILFRNVFDQTT